MKAIEKHWEINNYLFKNSSGPVEGLPEPDPDLFLSVVIPAYKEEKLSESIRSLLSCNPPDKPWEILVNVNYPAAADAEAVKVSLQSLKNAVNLKEEFSFRKDVRILPFLSPDLPDKLAGVGMARKVGMDEAVRRFSKLNRPEGIVAGFDADSNCGPNYLQTLFRFYKDHPKANTANIYFEHPTGTGFPKEVIDAIVLYELYLRYFRLALEETGHPHSIHTVGSSFTVRAAAYVRVGGMGRHQAGEDFYFLHKCIRLGNFYEINTTAVQPSSRESDRVIFGTGAAIRQQIIEGGGLNVFDLESFAPLKYLFNRAALFYDDSNTIERELIVCKEIYPALGKFLNDQAAAAQLNRMKNDSASLRTFSDKFFAWFNAFRVLRYLNESHKESHNRHPVQQMANQLAEKHSIATSSDPLQLLEGYRKFERTRGIRKIT